MKSRRISFWQGLLFVLFLYLPAFFQTNHSMAQTELILGVSYFDTLSSSGEQKYYQINVLAGEHLFVMLDKESSWESEIMIKYDALPTDADYDDKDGADGDNSDQAVEILSTQAGIYYIRVKSFSPSGGSYNVTAHDNTTMAALTKNVPTAGSLAWDGDEYYYQIQVPEGEHLFVMLDKSSSWDSEIMIKYDVLPTDADYDDKDGGNYDYSDQAVEILSTQAGYYYIRIKSLKDGGGSYNVGFYDNTALEALTKNVPTAGSLSMNYDEHYYQIQVPEGEHLFVMLDKESSWESEIMIKYDALPTDADYDDKDGADGDNSDQAVEILSTQAGIYYIRVKSFSPSGGSYTLTARTSLDELTTDVPVSGSLSWYGDTLYYQIFSPEGEHLYIRLSKDSSWNSTIYIRCGELPTTTEYVAMMSGYSDLEVEIPYTQEGYCYVMIVSKSSSGGSFSSSARSHLSEVNPDIHYSYDLLGRLTGVTYPSGKQITYTYDERGNRLEYIVTVGCVGDFEPDGDIDGKNLSELADYFGCTNNCGIFDLTDDGSVNAADLDVFAEHYGRNDCN